ncbi:SipW-dependent-type signal peptide-containing protein [Haloarchaeobius litoreus]|uniref:SipW-dependent-type signal peptide-containing protein n=1 Tax=Haloarchaeobius litoreus TaxID=755306 RepID=A0ABD6DDH1_9EURY|nr:SipW-dependent-type signal peptide-containing protein [Haloarchaeobius litoreus]
MTDEHTTGLTRRRILGGIGAVGVASVGAGLGTSAYFSDTESFEGNSLTAGELDLKVGWQQVYYGPNGLEPDAGPVRPRNDDLGEFVNANPDHDGDGEQSIDTEDGVYDWNMGGPTGADTDVTDVIDCDNVEEDYAEMFGDQETLVALDDVKPGDGGQITFNLCLCDNPGYIWLTLANFVEGENGITEPEGEVDSTPDDGELAEHVNVYVALDENCNSRFNDADTTVWSGTLAEAREEVETGSNGLLLSEDCFEGGECHCVNVGWEVPEDVGNVIQTDSVGFDIGFYTEQCRHNPDPCPCLADEFVVEAGGEQHCITAIEHDMTVDEFYNYSPHQAGEPALGYTESDRSQLFLYRNTGTGDTHLVMIHDTVSDGSGGAVTFEFDFEGIAPGSWAVQDDPEDVYTTDSGVISQADWTWANAPTDGGAIPVDGDPFRVDITPAFNDAAERAPLNPGEITSWVALSGDDAVVDLPMDEPVSIYPCDGSDL